MTPDMSDDLLIDAASFLAKRLRPTPLLLSKNVTGPGQLALKCESLQPTGSFKIRGATYFIGRLTEAEKAAGVVAYSTGNHAQAVAQAAALSGLSATIVMSSDVPREKLRATERLGAQIALSEPTSLARQEMAEAIHRRTGATLLPPFNDLRVIAGQGSIAFELNQQLDDETSSVTIYVPVGGGGLIAGVAAAMKMLRPHVRIVGVEPTLEDDGCRSYRAGRLITGSGPSASIADAVKVQTLGSHTFPIIRDAVDGMITADEQELRTACLQIVEKERLICEPAGALAYAAARNAAQIKPGLHVAVLSGGNIEWTRLATLIG